MQHGSAECKFSMAGEAHVQAMEDVGMWVKGECGAADTLVCSAMRGRACGASAGSEARALRGDTPQVFTSIAFSRKRFFRK